MAPMHGRGAMGFVLMGLFGFVVLLGGALSPSLPTALLGLAGVLVAGAGLALYWRSARTWRYALVYADRIEFVRGPQKGTLPFAEITGVHHLAWAKSLFPYSRGHHVLVLSTPRAEWQVGNELADHAEFQEAVLGALRRFHERAER
jgi:hypothetical protein